MAVQHDEITAMLDAQVQNGIAQIEEGNKSLLASEDAGTGDRDIDKAFKDATTVEKNDDGSVKSIKTSVPDAPANVNKAWQDAEKARLAYRDLVTKARNAYRVDVLKEEAKADSEDTDKEALKEVRKMVMEALSLMITYATANQKKDVVEWAKSISVPQVGRQGSSSAGGSKKPRAFVHVNGTVFDTFGEAAKKVSELLSSDDKKVTVSSGDLVQKWSDANEAENFEYEGVKIRVVLKNADKQ